MNFIIIILYFKFYYKINLVFKNINLIIYKTEKYRKI